MTWTHDFRHIPPGCVVAEDGVVIRVILEHGLLRRASALIPTLAVGIATLLAQPSFAAPAWLWWTSYGAFLAVLLIDARIPVSSGHLLWLAALCVSAVAVYLLAPLWSLSPVCLVTSGASAAFVLSTRGTLVVIGVQTAVLAAGQFAAGEPAQVALSVTATFGGFQLFTAVMALVAFREARTRDALAEANEELRAAQALLRSSTQASERLRISRDLHDLVGHQLTALALELEVASHHADGDAAAHVGRARRAAKDLLTDLRGAVSQLREPPGDVSAAVTSAVSEIGGPEVHFDIDDSIEFTDVEQAHTIVRCVQEIVTNAVRHSAAANLWIAVRRDGDGMLISARDDGCGAETVRPGNGLTGMRERFEHLGGELRYSSAPGAGFQLMARLPA